MNLFRARTPVPKRPAPPQQSAQAINEAKASYERQKQVLLEDFQSFCMECEQKRKTLTEEIARLEERRDGLKARIDSFLASL